MVDGKIRIGISGWRYDEWRGKFYPEKLRQKDELKYASEHLTSIEINGTFYSLQTTESFERWASETPGDFVFSVKGPRFITHIRRLRESESPLGNFYASGVLQLGEKLGPFLWQLPPNFKYDPERMSTFFKLLPRDAVTAAELAEQRITKIVPDMKELGPRNFPLRHAIEVRNESFRTPEFIELLREHNVALVCADTVEWPRLMDLTSDFVYCRLHGSEKLYANGYDRKSIDAWAKRAIAWSRGSEPDDAERVIEKSGPKCKSRDVFVYFDNDLKVKAPADAMSLIERIRQLRKPS
jgi:uncharacterized protein YecE (DUF72 family)